MFDDDDPKMDANEARQMIMAMLPEDVKEEMRKEVRVRRKLAEVLVSEYPDQPRKRQAMALSLMVAATKETPCCTIRLADKIGRLVFESEHANLTDLADGYGLDPVTGTIRKREDDADFGVCDDSDEDDPTVVN